MQLAVRFCCFNGVDRVVLQIAAIVTNLEVVLSTEKHDRRRNDRGRPVEKSLLVINSSTRAVIRTGPPA